MSSPPPAAADAATPSSTPNPTQSSPSSPSPPPKQHYLENDPDRTGFDPATKWWMNYFKILTGQVSPEGIHHYREWRYRQNEDRDCRRCEEARDYLLQYSPIVRFMAEKTEQLGGHRLDASTIVCARCPGRIMEDPVDGTQRVVRQGAGFHPGFGILLCSNEMRDRKHLEDNLAHEMVHAYDHLRWNVDWDNLRHAACSEIRASMLSGECRWTRESVTRGNWTVTQQFQQCVRRRAAQSLMARPRCRDEAHANKIVNEVWGSCFSDTRPFDDIYK